jgi:hypothetical protein
MRVATAVNIPVMATMLPMLLADPKITSSGLKTENCGYKENDC